MKYCGNYFFVILVIAFSLRGQELVSEQAPPVVKRSYTVRVLLAESPADCFVRWQVTTQKDFLFSSPEKISNAFVYNQNELAITFKDGNFFVNNKKYLKNQLNIRPCNGYLNYVGNAYGGSLLLLYQNNKVYLINVIELEDYVVSVLRTESWPGWPLEVNKVFAIACRSYAMHMIMKSQVQKLPYHIRNTNKHQTYTGMHTRADLRLAVEQTTGIFLSYDNEPIIAMFDTCCGGIIPRYMVGVDFAKAPYLARSYACTHCKRCKIFSWQAHYSLPSLELILQKEVAPLKQLLTVRIGKKDKAQITQEVVLVGKSGWHTVSGKKIYSLLKDKVKSFSFTVTKKGKNIVFAGRGYGHHLGICQWGAREMVRDGWDFKRILDFYYPGTIFMRLL